jgi:hypothetical protein
VLRLFPESRTDTITDPIPASTLKSLKLQYSLHYVFKYRLICRACSALREGSVVDTILPVDVCSAVIPEFVHTLPANPRRLTPGSVGHS